MTATTGRFDFAAPLPTRDQLGRVHLIAIGGAGMSAVAELLVRSGIAVSGSDAKDSPALRALAAQGAVVHVGHDPAYLAGADTVVVSSAIREDNPELAAARSRGLRVLHRAQALAILMRGRRTVAVAGANGKTTTTAMLTVALRQSGADPGFAIGGQPVQLSSNAAVGGGDIFVAEADESDGSFLVYGPEVGVVTNVQPDHLDFHRTFTAVQGAYDRFARSVSAGGLVVACADDAGSARLAQAARRRGQRVLTYGVGSDSDVRLGETASHGLRTTTTLSDQGRSHVLRLEIPGRHSVLDAAAAYIAATHGLGVDADAVVAGLGSFAGTRRRFEPVGEARGVRIVDDYAHNPGKVAALVETARGIAGDDRLVVAFQPHLYSRTRDFAGEFAAALSGADVVVVTDVYAAREEPLPGVTGSLIADLVAGASAPAGPSARPSARPEVHHVPDVARLATMLSALVRAGDLVVTVGAGDITGVGPQLLRLLRAAPSTTFPHGDGDGDGGSDSTPEEELT